MEYGTRHSAEVQSKIDGRLDAATADRLGSHTDPIDRDRLNGVGQNVAEVQGRVNGAGGEMAARRQLWEYNQKIREAAQEVNSIQKQISELENPVKQVSKGVEQTLGLDTNRQFDHTKAEQSWTPAGLTVTPVHSTMQAEIEAQQHQVKKSG